MGGRRAVTPSTFSTSSGFLDRMGSGPLRFLDIWNMGDGWKRSGGHIYILGRICISLYPFFVSAGLRGCSKIRRQRSAVLASPTTVVYGNLPGRQPMRHGPCKPPPKPLYFAEM